MLRIRSVRPHEGFTLELVLDDGSIRVVDVARLLRGPVFQPMREDPSAFRAVRVDPVLGTIVWPNGADLDPDVLVRGLEPAES